MSNIYITRKGEQIGPFPSAKIAGLVDEGTLAWDDMAWTDGMPEWRPLAEVYAEQASRGRINPDSGHLAEDKPPAFLGALPGAFVYPFRGSAAWIILVSGTILFSMMKIVTFAPIIGIFAYIILFGYFIAYLFAIIRETAIGENQVANFPSASDVWGDIIVPLMQFVFTTLGCMLPAIVAAIVLADRPAEYAWLPLILLYAGLFLLPMALLVTVIFNSVFTGLNPLFTLPSISRIFLRYLLIVSLLVATVLLGHHLDQTLRNSLGFLIAIPVLSFFSFYFGIVQAHILGLIYRTSSEQLGWFTR